MALCSFQLNVEARLLVVWLPPPAKHSIIHRVVDKITPRPWCGSQCIQLASDYSSREVKTLCPQFLTTRYNKRTLLLLLLFIYYYYYNWLKKLQLPRRPTSETTGNYQNASPWWPGGCCGDCVCQFNWSPAETEKKARTRCNLQALLWRPPVTSTKRSQMRAMPDNLSL